MRKAKRAWLLCASSVSLLSVLTATSFANPGSIHAASPRQGVIAQLTYVGDTSLGPNTLASGVGGNTASEISAQLPENDIHKMVDSPAQIALPNPAGSGVTAASSSASGFPGLDHFDSRTASNGNQFSLEPPDQGLCAGRSFVIEAVNDVMAVYNANSANHHMMGGPTALNAFFKLPPAIVRDSSGAAIPGDFGPFVTDPKCYYDPGTNRWFVTALEIDTNPANGAFGNSSHVYVAVSRGASPVGAWSVFTIDTTDTTGTPDHAGCPCFGDQPLIGADANGFYISTNEFPIHVGGFNGAQVYAVSKSGLVNAAHSGTLPAVVHINAGALPAPDGGIWYSIQPATTPPGGSYESAGGGTEYFLSALDFVGAGDTRIAAWALTNTSSLNSASPNVSLTNTIVNSEAYGAPAAFYATQKAGPTPLGNLVGGSLEAINANDDRMNQVVFANGKLWSGLNTATVAHTVAIAYFIVAPSEASGTLTATMANQGYVAAPNGNNVLFPSIGVNPQGKGIMAFTLSGPDYYPSAAFAAINAASGAGAVTVSGSGIGPEDGFTGYPAYGGDGIARWGDYSAAVADVDGSIWFASEYIGQSCTLAQFEADTTCGGTRTSLANWGTFISHMQP